MRGRVCVRVHSGVPLVVSYRLAFLLSEFLVYHYTVLPWLRTEKCSYFSMLELLSATRERALFFVRSLFVALVLCSCCVPFSIIVCSRASLRGGARDVEKRLNLACRSDTGNPVSAAGRVDLYTQHRLEQYAHIFYTFVLCFNIIHQGYAKYHMAVELDHLETGALNGCITLRSCGVGERQFHKLDYSGSSLSYQERRDLDASLTAISLKT